MNLDEFPLRGHEAPRFCTRCGLVLRSQEAPDAEGQCAFCAASRAVFAKYASPDLARA